MSEFKHEYDTGETNEEGFVYTLLEKQIHPSPFYTQNEPIACHDTENNIIASVADLIGSGGHVANW